MALTAFQTEIQNLARAKGLRGAAEQQVYSTPEYQQLVQRFFGNVPLPPGVDPSMVIEQSAGVLRYRDAEGYEHILRRNLDGSSPDIGRVGQDETNRPAVLPVTKQVPGTEQAIQQALGVLSGTFGAGGGAQTQSGDGQFFGLPVPGLPGTNTPPVGQATGTPGILNPADNALFDAITKATIEQLRQQFTSQGGRLVAELYGKGMNQSSLANDAVNLLQQGQGLVLNQALSDDAARRLERDKFLKELSTKSALDLFNSIMGNETSRSVSSGQLGLGREELGQRTIDSARNFQIEQQKLELQKKAMSPWRSILSAVASLGAAAIPGLGLLGGARGSSGQSGYPIIGMDT